MIDWNAKLREPLPRILLRTETQAGRIDRPATVRDIREFLLPLGLDLVTKDALNWGTRFIRQARNLTRICELQQRVADLQHLLRSRHQGLSR